MDLGTLFSKVMMRNLKLTMVQGEIQMPKVIILSKIFSVVCAHHGSIEFIECIYWLRFTHATNKNAT